MLTITPPPFAAHRWQHEARQTNRSPEVRLHRGSGMFLGEVFDRPAHSDAGVVDEDVDPAVSLQDVGDCGSRRCFVVDVECNHLQPDAHSRCSSGECIGLGRIAHRGDDRVAVARELDSGLKTDPRRATSDERDSHDVPRTVDGGATLAAPKCVEIRRVDSRTVRLHHGLRRPRSLPSGPPFTTTPWERRFMTRREVGRAG